MTYKNTAKISCLQEYIEAAETEDDVVCHSGLPGAKFLLLSRLARTLRRVLPCTSAQDRR